MPSSKKDYDTVLIDVGEILGIDHFVIHPVITLGKFAH